MTHFKGLTLPTGAELRERAIGAVRPSVEAMLLAAVALGCAQAGWSVLAPSTAGALSAASEDDRDPSRLLVSEVVSPFAPDLLESDAASHAAAALLSGIQLNGVRIADEPGRSGAILTLNDGSQHAFAVGQEISAGVTLAQVSDTYVLVAYQGGQQQISIASAAPTFSFARAMMGMEQTLGAPAEALTVSETPLAAGEQTQRETAPASFSSAALPALELPEPDAGLFAAENLFAPAASPEASFGSLDDMAWLQSLLMQVESQDGRAAGWRVPASLPAAAAQAGLRAGDLVTAVNGAGPDNLAQVLLSTEGGRFALSVERGGEILTLVIEANGHT